MSDTETKLGNELKQFSKRDMKVFAALKEIEGVDRITVCRVDFSNGHLAVRVNDVEPTYEGILTAAKFCSMTNRMQIQTVDFETGEIVVTWTPNMLGEVTREEAEFLEKGQLIYAIKSIRARTNTSLAEAKKLAEKAREEILAGWYK